MTLSGRGKLPAARTLSALLSDEGYVITETKPAADTNRLGKIARLPGWYCSSWPPCWRWSDWVWRASSPRRLSLIAGALRARAGGRSVLCAALVGASCSACAPTPWQPLAGTGHLRRGRLASFTGGSTSGHRWREGIPVTDHCRGARAPCRCFHGHHRLEEPGLDHAGACCRGHAWGFLSATAPGRGARDGGRRRLTVFVLRLHPERAGLAALSGSALAGAGAMLAFALGTAPSLLALGLSATGLARRPQYSRRLTALTGAALVAFALYSANAQLNVLGLPSASDLGTLVATRSQAQAATGPALPRVTVSSSLPTAAPPQDEVGLAPMVEGVQVLQMEAGPYYYTPSHFRLRAGVPARWEITDRGASGCTNAIISRGLFPDRVDLKRGGVVVKEFVPERPGLYKFSCWMGMVAGTIEVIEAS